MSNGNQKIKVLVIGDINIDTIIVPVPPECNSSRGHGRDPQAENNRCIRYRQPGGAWLLSSIIDSAVNFRSAEYDLRLMSEAAADRLASEGRNLVIVALVGTDLYIRIFDASGNKVVDKAENALVSGETLTALKK